MIAAAFVAALLIPGRASAQLGEGLHFGVVGGMTYSGASSKDFDASNVFLYHAGLTFKANIVGGLAVQPSLLYQVKGATLDKYISGEVAVPGSFQTSVGFLELPVNISWGPSIGDSFRPYLFLEPFVGYALTGDSAISVKAGDIKKEIDRVKNEWEDTYIRRFEYGIGAGLGLEVWRFQISLQYFLNFGSLANEEGKISASAIGTTVSNAFKDGANFKGFKASLAFLF